MFRLYLGVTRAETANVCVQQSPTLPPPAATTVSVCAGDLNIFVVCYSWDVVIGQECSQKF